MRSLAWPYTLKHPHFRSSVGKWLVLSLVSLLCACTEDQHNQVKHSDLITGLASPVQLPVVSPATITLGDYVLDPDRVDSFSVDAPFSVEPNSADSSLLQVAWHGAIPPVAAVRLWSEGIPSTILLLRSKKQPVQLAFEGEAHTVEVAGEFSSWSTKGQGFDRNGTVWTRTLYLDPGLYQYQLVVDGKWQLDPANPDSVDNNVGGFNSLISVPLPDDAELPLLLSRDHDGGYLRFELRHIPERVFALWENHQIPDEMIGIQGNELTVTLPEVAKQASSSVVRIWSYDRNGVSNDVYIPLKHGKPVRHIDQLDRTDWHAAQMYFMMVDRFVNGDTTIDRPVPDPDIHFKANYQGGDLAGIRNTLEAGYFDQLNTNTLWVSPITQNPEIGYVEYPEPHRKFSGYHGYWPVLSTVVDHRFGDAQTLTRLIDDVHANDMNIILDFVSNHVHEDHPIVKEHPEWRTPLHLPDGSLNIRIWEDQRLTTWFDTFLPSLDHSIPAVTEMLSDTALFWVSAFEFDGFRHDAAKHIPQSFWRTLTRKIKERVLKEQGRNILQMGETFGSRELIGSYIGSGMMDGKFDFNLYFDARNVFALDSEDFDRLGTSLRSSLSYYGYHHLMGNITGNHDLPRFISYASGALQFGEDDKEAGWNRNITVKDPVGYRKLEQLIAFMWTIPGIPVLYYGDEFGMPGAGDPDNRRMMRFDLSENEQKTLRTTRSITRLRKENLALQYGDLYDLCAQGKLMHYRRRYFDEEIIVMFNKDSVAHWLPIHTDTEQWTAQFGSKVKRTDDGLEVKIPAYGFEVLTKGSKTDL